MKPGRVTVGLYTILMAGILGVCVAAIHSTITDPVAEPLPLSNARLSPDPSTQTAQIVSVIQETFGPLEDEIPGVVDTMVAIADCESYGGNDGTLMHTDPDGELVKNPGSSATGVFQVLLYTHRNDYENLGLDPRGVVDNVLFARELVERRHERGLYPYGDWECAH